MKIKTPIMLGLVSTTFMLTDLIIQNNPVLAQVPSGELGCVYRSPIVISGVIVGRSDVSVLTDRVNSSIMVRNAKEFREALNNSAISTIFLAYNGSFDFAISPTASENIIINRSVSIIGERGPLCERPIVRLNNGDNQGGMWTIAQGNVEIRGIHFIGAANTDENRSSSQPGYNAISAIRAVESKERLLIVDNEFNEWTGAGIYVVGEHDVRSFAEYADNWPRPTEADGDKVRIERNYFHHNARDGLGYGVKVDGGIHAWIMGNLFNFNRHAVSSSGSAYSGYTAKFNYVMQGGYRQGVGYVDPGYYNQHFDVHGSNSNGYGGNGGDRFLIANNTIRGAQTYRITKTRPAFVLRGKAKSWARFNDNVVVHTRAGKAIQVKISTTNSEPFTPYNLSQTGNQYDVDNVNQMLMGDFDGDRNSDLLLTNGTGWWVSRSFQQPFEYLRASAKLSQNLAISDVDGDKIDDVLFIEDSAIKYVSGGSGFPKVLATLPADSIDVSMQSVAVNGKKVCFVNKTGKVYELQTNRQGIRRWLLLRNDGKDVTVDSDGTHWLIDKSGYIYMRNGSNWTKMSGSDGVRISAGGGQVWLINTVGKIYKWGGTQWNKMPGSDATDIAVSNSGNILLTTKILVPDRPLSVPRPPVPSVPRPPVPSVPRPPVPSVSEYKIDRLNYKWNGSSWSRLYGDF